MMAKKISGNFIFLMQLIAFGMFCSHLKAQHCQYDNYSLIGVVPSFDNGNTCVSDLKITLLDQNGKSVGRFWRNVQLSIDPEHKKQVSFSARNFANAQYHYVLVHRNFDWSSAATRYTIKIEDTVITSSRPRAETILIPLDKKHDNSLCTYGAVDNKLPVSYVPLNVQLVPAKETASADVTTTADSVFVLSGDIVFNPTKTVKQSGIDTYGNIFGPYETHRLFSMYHAHTGHLIATATAPYNAHLACMDSLEVADYNFDGYADLRFCNPPNYEYLYLLYDAEKDTFFYNNLLSTLDDIKIDAAQKRITGSYSIVGVRYNDMNVKIGSVLVSKEYYQLSGEGLRQISKITVHYNEHGKSTKIDTTYFTLKNQKLSPVSKETYESWSSLSPVKVETSVAQVDSMEIIDGNILFKIKIVKPALYTDGGLDFAHQSPYRMFEMRDIYTNQVLHQSKQVYLANVPCMDSIEINDFNFDNNPDLRSCNGNDGSTYLVFDAASNTFIPEPYLSKLQNINFNWHDATVEGYISYYQTDFNNKWSMPNKRLIYREFYRFCGTGLQYVERITAYYNRKKRVTSTKTAYFHYQSYNLIPVAFDQCSDTPVDANSTDTAIEVAPAGPEKISSELNSIRFELTRASADYYQPGVTSQHLRIWMTADATNKAIMDSGLDLQEYPFDALEAGYFNFDAIPDVCIFSELNPAKRTYFVSYLTAEKQVTFYQDKFLSALSNLSIDSTNHRISGLLLAGTDTTFYSFHGPQMDTLIIRGKNPNNGVPYTNTFRYVQNRIENIDPPYVSPIRIIDGKEYADFNFDGFEDYRIAGSGERQYTYYCWDPKESDFVLHETLSMMQNAQFDWKNKLFIGNQYHVSDEVVISDTFQLRDGKIVVTERIISYKTDNSGAEQRYQELYQWQEGKLVLISSGYVE